MHALDADQRWEYFTGAATRRLPGQEVRKLGDSSVALFRAGSTGQLTTTARESRAIARQTVRKRPVCSQFPLTSPGTATGIFCYNTVLLRYIFLKWAGFLLRFGSFTLS